MNVVILHGTKGHPGENWFPWLKKCLEEEGVRVFVPKLPTPENQTPEDWFQALENQNVSIDKDTVLIGHSSGSLFMNHILEKYPVKQSIYVAYVSGIINIPEYDELNTPFFKEFDWNKIKRNAGDVTIIHGTNDPYVPLSQPKSLHQSVGGNYVEVPGGGHLNAEAGYNEFPRIFGLLELQEAA